MKRKEFIKSLFFAPLALLGLSSLKSCFRSPQSPGVVDPDIPARAVLTNITGNHGHSYVDMTIDDIVLRKVATYRLDGDITDGNTHFHDFRPTLQQMTQLEAGQSVTFFVTDPSDLHSHSFRLRRPED